ncbi:SRPBCC family protein [Rhodococcus sp. NPDC127528]|uniref:SRPBCC family protein n=1 Tax=unclassified Rhodococcus (in: high G+C Gram-positive bacteria) TaxID=192944 RepID=UPI00362D1998
MKLQHEFPVSAPVDVAWEALTDLESVAGLLPGAQLTGRDGDAYLGRVKVKVGPVVSEFAGRAEFREKDDAAHHAVIEAKGRDSRGGGNASATITVALDEHEGRTSATVDTDMKVVGKLAQFGSGMIAQVSEKLMDQFVDALEAKLSGGSEQPTLTVVPTPGEREGLADSVPAQAEPEPLDLVALARPTLVRWWPHAVAALLAGIAVVTAIRLLRRR